MTNCRTVGRTSIDAVLRIDHAGEYIRAGLKPAQVVRLAKWLNQWATQERTIRRGVPIHSWFVPRTRHKFAWVSREPACSDVPGDVYAWTTKPVLLAGPQGFRRGRKHGDVLRLPDYVGRALPKLKPGQCRKIWY